MKKMYHYIQKRRLTALILSVLMALTLIPAASFAEAAESTAGSNRTDKAFEELARQLQNPYSDPFDYRTKSARNKAALQAENSYPESYDLRNVDGKSYVTPVRFQNPFGTCWGFAAIAAAESSILGSGLAAQDGYDVSNFDLSEKHLAYFLNQAISDKSNPQYGEGTHADDDVTLTDLLNGGGVPYIASSLFASGIGPNLESRDPLLKYMGKNGWTEKRTINGKVTDFCYDDEDDWSIPEEWRFKQSYVLKESYMLPSPAGKDEETGEYIYNQAGTDAIKKLLLDKKAVQIGFCADVSLPSQDPEEGQYISTNWAHYTYDDDAQANHAVAIVGWDDNYDKSNFIDGHQPPENGAWLVKNSWGSGENEFPDNGGGNWGIEVNGVHTGYFWLSYYDKTLSLPEALGFEKSNVQSSYIIDQHDFMPVNDMTGAALPDEVMSSNIFKADECETLDKVSCVTTYPGTEVINEVYILPDDFNSPVDGIKVESIKDTFEFGGFHTMALKTPVIIQKGQYYSVVQKMVTADGDNVFNLPYAFNKDLMSLLGAKSWIEGVINPKESFLYVDGSWFDFSEEETRKKLFGEMQIVMTFDNFPIKAYCTPKSNLNLRIRGSAQMDLDEQSRFTLIYKGNSGDSFDAPAISWSLADGGSEYFTLTPDPENPHVVTVTAKAVGESYLYVTAEGIGTTVIRLSVTKRTPTAISFFGEYVYNGKKRKPSPVVEDQDGNVIPASHYTVSYKKNIKCGEAQCFVKIKEGDPVYEGEMDGSFTIIPRKAVIKKLIAGSKKLTIKIRDGKSTGVAYCKVRYRVKGGSKWKTRKVKVSSKNRVILKKLKKGKRYQVKVCGMTKDEFEGKYSKAKTSAAVL